MERIALGEDERLAPCLRALVQPVQGTRSPIANTRLSLDPTGRVVLSLKRPLRDGRTELTFTPIDFLRRLATLLPPPRRRLFVLAALPTGKTINAAVTPMASASRRLIMLSSARISLVAGCCTGL